MRQSNQSHRSDDVTIVENSQRWGEFRLSVVGNLVVSYTERGRLAAALKSLAAKGWKHPITGKRVTFGYSTIERWYYIALNNSKARFRALAKKRCDAGIHRSLTKQVRHYLAAQAKLRPSSSYTEHHKRLIKHMKVRGWGRPPGYSTVVRYAKSLYSSQDASGDAETKRLEGLVTHLRKILIVESTINRLLRVPELRPKTAGPPFKFVRLGARERAYVLSRLKDYRSAGGSRSEFCSGIGISTASVERWGALYRVRGEAGLTHERDASLPIAPPLWEMQQEC